MFISEPWILWVLFFCEMQWDAMCHSLSIFLALIQSVNQLKWGSNHEGLRDRSHFPCVITRAATTPCPHKKNPQWLWVYESLINTLVKLLAWIWLGLKHSSYSLARFPDGSYVGPWQTIETYAHQIMMNWLHYYMITGNRDKSFRPTQCCKNYRLITGSSRVLPLMTADKGWLCKTKTSGPVRALRPVVQYDSPGLVR